MDSRSKPKPCLMVVQSESVSLTRDLDPFPRASTGDRSGSAGALRRFLWSTVTGRAHILTIDEPGIRNTAGGDQKQQCRKSPGARGEKIEEDGELVEEEEVHQQQEQEEEEEVQQQQQQEQEEVQQQQQEVETEIQPRQSMRIFFFIFIILAFVLVTNLVVSNENKITNEDSEETFPEMDTVLAFMEKLGTLSSATADVGARSDILSKQSYALLKLGLPVGSLMAGSLRIATKPEARAYLALKQLNNTIVEQFENLAKQMSFAVSVISLEMKLHDYINQVQLPSIAIQQTMSLFWNPSVNKSPDLIAGFKKMCYDADPKSVTPLTILNYIHVHVVRNCNSGLSIEQTQVLAKLYGLLTQAREKITGAHDQQQFSAEAEEYVVWFSSLSTKNANDVLTKLKKRYAVNSSMTAEVALNELSEVFTSNAEKQNSMCLLQDVIVAKQYDHKAVEELEQLIRVNILEQMIFGAICANLTFNGDLNTMLWYQNQIVHRVKDILSHMQTYVSKELTKSFPHIEIASIKAKLDSLPLPYPVTSIDQIYRISVSIFDELAKIGSKRFKRQGFVVDQLKLDDDYTFICPPEACFSMLNYKSLHIFVTRYDKEVDQYRAMDAEDWFTFRKREGSIKDLVWKKIDENYNTGRVSDLMKTIESKIGNLTNQRYYRHMAFMRNSGDTGLCAVKAGVSLIEISSLPAYGTVCYRYEGSFFRQCEDYKLFLFV